MASGVRGGAGDAGEGEWLKVAELKAMAGAQDPQAKVCMFSFHDSSVNSFFVVVVFHSRSDLSMHMFHEFLLSHRWWSMCN
jgi:hypothetical protein